MQFTDMLRARESASAKIYLKTSDGTEFRGTVKTIGDDYIQLETDQGRLYAVMVAHIVFAGP